MSATVDNQYALKQPTSLSFVLYVCFPQHLQHLFKIHVQVCVVCNVLSDAGGTGFFVFYINKNI